MVLEIEITPISSLFFRRPSEFHPAVTGPTLAAASLSFPMPSTIAGALTYKILEKSPNKCQLVKRELHEVLKFLNVNFYVGLALYGGKVYYATPLGLVKRDNMILQDNGNTEDEGEYSKPLKLSKIGIALDRRTKNTRTGYLYVSDRLYYPTGFSFLVLADFCRSNLVNAFSGTVRFGGDQGLAKISTRNNNVKLEQHLVLGDPYSERWKIVLIAPALLEKSPWEGIVELSGDKVKEIGKMLLNDKLYIEKVVIPKGELSLEVARTGWSLASNRPKEPALIVPIGTEIYVSGSYTDIVKVIRDKLGHSMSSDPLGRKREGWGTAVAISLQ